MNTQVNEILEIVISSQLDQNSSILEKGHHQDCSINLLFKTGEKASFLWEQSKPVNQRLISLSNHSIAEDDLFNRMMQYVLNYIKAKREGMAINRTFEILLDTQCIKNIVRGLDSKSAPDFESLMHFATTQSFPLEGYLVSYEVDLGNHKSLSMNIKWLTDYTISSNHDFALELFRLAHPQMNLSLVQREQNTDNTQTITSISNPLTGVKVTIANIRYSSVSRNNSGNAVFDCKTMIYRHDPITPSVRFINP